MRSSPQSLTTAFVAQLQQLTRQPLPDIIVHQAKRCLLDYLGAAFAGASHLRPRLKAILEFSSSGSGAVRVIGTGEKASVQIAALCNGTAAHALEMDDGSRFGMIHPGAPVLSALLPVAERFGVDGSRVLLGIVVGYECAIRLASAVAPSHYHKGFHPTATCGAIGATAGVAAMLDFSTTEFEAAISAAAIAAGGSLKVVDPGSQLKPLNAGRAAAGGVVSAMVARAGFLSSPAGLEGPTGFLQIMCDRVAPELLLSSCEGHYHIQRVYMKPYAACRHAHPAIDACLRYRNEHGGMPHDLEAITIRTYGGLEGRHDHRHAVDAATARMSIPVSCAVALHRGAAGVADFTSDVLASPAVWEVAEKVRIVKEDSIDAMLPHARVAVVEFVLASGHSQSVRIEVAKGEPENPLTDDEARQKFSALASLGGKHPTEIAAIVKAVAEFPSSADCLWDML